MGVSGHKSIATATFAIDVTDDADGLNSIGNRLSPGPWSPRAARIEFPKLERAGD